MRVRLGVLSSSPLILSMMAACGAPASQPAVKPVAGAPAVLVERVAGPPKLLPDLGGAHAANTTTGEHEQLVDRLRVLVRDDGSILRAHEMLPQGSVLSIDLPTRLGGGYLFFERAPSSTPIWHAPSWLADLAPVVTLPTDIREIIAGFDRLYVRFNGGRLGAIDAKTGDARSLSPLPPSDQYGPLVFADGWRAVVDTDLRGALATFDAGTTWRSTGIKERISYMVVRRGNPVVGVAGGEYTIDANGRVTFNQSTPPEQTAAPHESVNEASGKGTNPLGKRALRAATEDGFPDSATTAIVARSGALVRVSLTDGAVLATVDDAFPEREARCHAVRIEKSWGFVCGERDGATIVYAYADPLAVKPILRFAKPRFVSASGNGALVVRGPCTDDDAPSGDARSYCIRGVNGAQHEVRVKGDLGVERVVALADGRVVVLVPPRGDSSGQVTVLNGASGSSAPLKLPVEPHAVARELRRGMWLDSFEEVKPGVLGGWVEAGGPTVGITIDLQGQVKAGELRDDTNGVVFGGKLAIAVGDDGHAAESIDGGFNWTPFELPKRADEDKAPTRGCGPVGCALQGWIRVGWGKVAAADESTPADPPPEPYASIKEPNTLSFRCELENNVTPPLPEKPAKVAAAPPPPPPRYYGMGRRYGMAYVAPNQSNTPMGWIPFRNTAAPALDKDDVGYDFGPFNSLAEMRAYAWGKHGADWTKAGRWMIRFDDRFDPTGGLRSSAVSASLWPDESQAAEAIFSGGGGQWVPHVDPAGQAMLVESCRGGICQLYAASEGQPILPIRDSHGTQQWMMEYAFPSTAVRVGETWFFLRPAPSYENVELWRADLGVARRVTSWHRPPELAGTHPMLVRRNRGTSLGVLVVSTPEVGQRDGIWYVLPIDPETGDLGDAVALVRHDFDHVPLDRCGASQDGWLLETPAATYPHLEIGGAQAPFDPAVSFRVLLDPGAACVQAMATVIHGALVKGKPEPKTDKEPPVKPEEAIPFAATEQGAGRRWNFRCKRRRLLGY